MGFRNGNHDLNTKQLLQISFDAIKDGIGILDTDLRILRVNRAMEQLYSHAMPLVGKKCYEVYQLDQQPCRSCSSQKAMQSGEPSVSVVPLTGEEGQVGWLQLTAYPIKGKQGQVIGVVKIVHDISEEVEREKESAETVRRAVRQRTALAKLFNEPQIKLGDLDAAAKVLTEIASAAILVERTSLWLLSEDSRELRCLDLYELSKRKHSSGMILRADNYPRYFEAIKKESRVYAEDAYEDSRTSEFAATYLDLFGVRSMLDAGIIAGGELVGVFCFENVGDTRPWHAEEESFASTVAAIAAQVIESSRRLEAEKAKVESEHKYRTLFQNSADPLLIMQDVFVDCNDEACRYWGYTQDEIIGRSPVDFSPPFQPDGRKTAEAAEVYIDEALKGTPQTFYWQHQHRNGHLLDTEVRLNGVEIGGEKFLIAAVRDIGERKQAEEIILQNRDWYRALAEDIPVLVTRASPEGKVTYVNEASRSLIAKPIEKIIGSDFYALVPEEYRKEVEKSFKSLTPENPVVIFEHYNKDRLFRWKNRAVFNADRTIREYFTVGEDITEYYLAEQKLRDSELRSRAMMEAMPDKIFRYSNEGNYLDAQVRDETQLTVKARQLYREKRLIGSNIAEVFTPELAQLLMAGIDEALKSGKVQILEYSYPTEQAVGYFEARLIATGDEEVISIVRDITERHHTEEAMQYQLQLEMLVAQISSLFVNTPSDKIDKAINRALMLSGEFFGADRSYLMQFTDDQKYITNPYEWCAEGVNSVQERNQKLPVANTPWWAKQILSKDFVLMPDVDLLPPEAEVDKTDFLIEEIKSMITFPVVRQDKVFAFFGFDAVKAKKSWTDQQISMIRVIAEIIAEALAKAEAEEALKESEERYREILSTIEEGYYEADLNGRITFCNDAAGRLFGGYSREELTGMSYKELYKNPEQCFTTFNRVFMTGIPEKGLILEMIKKDGTLAFGEISVSLTKDNEGFITGFKGIGREVTERMEYEKRLEYLSLHDQLTGIHNRAYYESELERLEGGRDYPITIITADLDGLKLINDTLGHDVGDRLLCQCAVLLKDSLRHSDLLARVGGDEFSAILRRTDKATGEIIVRRIREKIVLYNQEEGDVPLGMSVGLATAEGSKEPLREIYKYADDSMYRDKLYRSSSSRGKIVQSLLAALAERDYITEGHARRLEDLCRAIGEKINLSSHQLADLALLAQVHDLGKVGIPDQILDKPGPLTEKEWEVMRGHPEKGYRIASASPDLVGVADLILKHHERWDGSGYPLGLKGEEIPIECRIMAIIDAYDAMTNERPYNEVKSRAEALAEIKNFSGSQFDPDLVTIFFEIIDQGAELGKET